MTILRSRDDVLEAIAAAKPGEIIEVPSDFVISADIEQRALSRNLELRMVGVPPIPNWLRVGRIQPTEGQHAAIALATAVKDTNPKDAVGTKKAPLSTLPWRVLWNVGLAMLEGALKYGRHNYRAAGVRASVYFDAAMRHIGSWWEGEDIDPDSALHHVDKAIATLMVLRDSIIQGNWVDDRPPGQPYSLAPANEHAAELIKRYGDRSPKHWTHEDTLP